MMSETITNTATSAAKRRATYRSRPRRLISGSGRAQFEKTRATRRCSGLARGYVARPGRVQIPRTKGLVLVLRVERHRDLLVPDRYVGHVRGPELLQILRERERCLSELLPGVRERHRGGEAVRVSRLCELGLCLGHAEAVL